MRLVWPGRILLLAATLLAWQFAAVTMGKMLLGTPWDVALRLGEWIGDGTLAHHLAVIAVHILALALMALVHGRALLVVAPVHLGVRVRRLIAALPLALFALGAGLNLLFRLFGLLAFGLSANCASCPSVPPAPAFSRAYSCTPLPATSAFAVNLPSCDFGTAAWIHFLRFFSAITSPCSVRAASSWRAYSR